MKYFLCKCIVLCVCQWLVRLNFMHELTRNYGSRGQLRHTVAENQFTPGRVASFQSRLSNCSTLAARLTSNVHFRTRQHTGARMTKALVLLIRCCCLGF